MIRFTIGLCLFNSGRHGIRTHMAPCGTARFSKPARPTVSGYLPYQWTHRELNPDFQPAELASSRLTMSPCCSVDLMGVEPNTPTLQESVAPSGMQARFVRGPSGN